MRDISFILGQTKLLNVPLKIEHATQQIECNFKFRLQSLTYIFYLSKFLSYQAHWRTNHLSLVFSFIKKIYNERKQWRKLNYGRNS